jgi:uncharacterized membrane protein
MPEAALYCADCGAPIDLEHEVRDEGETNHLSVKTRAVAAASYVAVMPAILWLFLKPVRREAFVRFHAFQSIIFGAAAVLIGIAVRILWIPLLALPAGLLLAILATIVVSVGCFVLWAVVFVKAGLGAKFHIPLLGTLAERLAASYS